MQNEGWLSKMKVDYAKLKLIIYKMKVDYMQNEGWLSKMKVDYAKLLAWCSDFLIEKISHDTC